jgi:phosphoenolpyruvate-protein kinase (PTS system EI component)
MVETPAASEIVSELAREVDFFSIGTNDLVQYSLVVDREDPRMASDWHAYHPAILRVIRRVVRDAHLAGKPVSVCGEMAARPDLAIALLALGVDALSVTPPAIPELKQVLASVALEPLRASIDEVLALSTGAEIATSLRRYVSDGTLHGTPKSRSNASSPRHMKRGARRPNRKRRWVARTASRRRRL